MNFQKDRIGSAIGVIASFSVSCYASAKQGEITCQNIA